MKSTRVTSRLKLKLILYVALLLLVPLFPSAAYGGLVTLHGNVKDPLGRPLSGVRVTNSFTGNFGTSDGQGRWSFNEDYIGSYRLTASRAGLNRSDPLVVDAPQALLDVDFTLTYILTGSVTPSAFNNTSPTTVQVTANSHAPLANQCVVWKDLASGSQVALLHTGTSGSVITWGGNYVVASSVNEGTFQWELTSYDCSSSIGLTNLPRSGYIVDRTPPSIPLAGLTPVAGLQTMFLNQPLSAKVADPLSGVPASGIRFTLRNVISGPQVSDIPAQTYGDGVAVSAPHALSTGNRYNVAVTATDRAGNTSTTDQADSNFPSWLAISVTPGAVSAEIPRVEDTSLAGDLINGYRATFTNVTLQASQSTVGFSSSAHSGFAKETLTVPLTSAQVCNNAPVPNCQPAGLTTNTMKKVFAVAKSAGPLSATVPAHEVSLGDLTIPVPITHTDPYLVMDPLSVTPSLDGCPAPNGSGCDPDPLSLVASNVPDVSGVVTNTDPYTVKASLLSSNGTVVIEKISPTVLREVVEITNPDGSISTWTATVTNNGDGTASIRVLGPGGYDVTTTKNYGQTENVDNCQTCWEAKWAAAAVCATGNPVACSIAVYAAYAWCRDHPCPAPPSCEAEAYVLHNSDTYTNPPWNIYNSNYVTCHGDFFMDELKVDATFHWYDPGGYWPGGSHHYGEVRCAPEVYSCHNDSLWHTEYPWCMYSTMTWSGKWTDRGGEIHPYGGSNTSNTYCGM